MQMLRIFLQQLIPAMEYGTALMTPLAVLLAILVHQKNEVWLQRFKSAAYWAFWLSIYVIIAKQGTRSAVNRELFEAWMAAPAVISEVVLCGLLLTCGKKLEKFSGLFGWSVRIMVAALSLYYLMEIWLIPVTTVLNVDTMVSYIGVVRMLGFATGLIIAYVGSWLIYHAAKSMHDVRLNTVFAVQVAALLFQQIVFLVQMLMARNILPARTMIKIMAPLINHSSWIIFVVFIAVFVVPIALFMQKCPERLPEQNPAQYRMVVADDIHKKRWGKASLATIICIIFMSSFGSAFANKQEEEVPAIGISIKAGVASIPIKDVNDGHLHRYSYRTKKGKNVRFIVVLKGGSAYGVGLDNCEICGPTGYIERDGQVVCKLCDVMMNKATIGLPGGCNPIPLNYGVANGSVQVKEADLEAAGKHF